MKKERIIQKLARVYLNELAAHIPICHWRIFVEKRWIEGKLISNELRGFPDLLISYRGIFIGAEAKAPEGKQSEDQKIMEQRIKYSDGEYFLFHSLDELVSNLQEIARKHLVSELAETDQTRMCALLKNLESRPRIKRISDLLREADVPSDIDSAEECLPPFH